MIQTGMGVKEYASIGRRGRGVAAVLDVAALFILVVCLPNGFTIRQRSTWPPGLPPLPMGED